MISMIVIATRNANKVEEFRQILKDFPVELKSLADFGPLPEAIEDGNSFDENAYKKAIHTAKILGLPAIADDSGLVVEALNGEPGIYSARYAGVNATDDENCQKLLAELAEKPNRKASFHCVISIAVPSGPALTYESQCEGVILKEKIGQKGFGYDPLFLYEPLQKTFAQLSPSEKNAVSHRGKALKEFSGELPKVIKWLEQRLAEEKPPKPDHSLFADNDWSKER